MGCVGSSTAIRSTIECDDKQEQPPGGKIDLTHSERALLGKTPSTPSATSKESCTNAESLTHVDRALLGMIPSTPSSDLSHHERAPSVVFQPPYTDPQPQYTPIRSRQVNFRPATELPSHLERVLVGTTPSTSEADPEHSKESLPGQPVFQYAPIQSQSSPPRPQYSFSRPPYTPFQPRTHRSDQTPWTPDSD